MVENKTFDWTDKEGGKHSTPYSRRVKLLGIRGFVIHRPSDGGGRGWGVSHQASGKCVLVGPRGTNQAKAIELAEERILRVAKQLKVESSGIKDMINRIASD